MTKRRGAAGWLAATTAELAASSPSGYVSRPVAALLRSAASALQHARALERAAAQASASGSPDARAMREARAAHRDASALLRDAYTLHACDVRSARTVRARSVTVAGWASATGDGGAESDTVGGVAEPPPVGGGGGDTPYDPTLLETTSVDLSTDAPSGDAGALVRSGPVVADAGTALARWAEESASEPAGASDASEDASESVECDAGAGGADVAEPESEADGDDEESLDAAEEEAAGVSPYPWEAVSGVRLAKLKVRKKYENRAEKAVRETRERLAMMRATARQAQEAERLQAEIERIKAQLAGKERVG